MEMLMSLLGSLVHKMYEFITIDTDGMTDEEMKKAMDRHILNCKMVSKFARQLPGKKVYRVNGKFCKPAYWVFKTLVEIRDNTAHPDTEVFGVTARELKKKHENTRYMTSEEFYLKS